ncbi:ephrin-A4-like, partial [Carassius auratus]|uniref:Ephrin-A4-like n=1 Tax=Carassius auratus TaxID=7957 RepID=A0A6P6N866_CARAU
YTTLSLSLALRLTGDDYSVQVNLSDYLDILCPHYPADPPSSGPVETLALYLVSEAQFRGCVETKEAIKRWECNQPYAPYGPVRFSEKIQRFTPFSLGFEFLPGHHYYYSSLSTDDGPPLPCMKLRVTVCCPPTTAGSSRREDTERPSPSSAVRPVTFSPPHLPLIVLFSLIFLFKT